MAGPVVTSYGWLEAERKRRMKRGRAPCVGCAAGARCRDLSRRSPYPFGEGEPGSIKVGAWADLVVTERDYLACPEAEIRRIESLLRTRATSAYRRPGSG